MSKLLPLKFRNLSSGAPRSTHPPFPPHYSGTVSFHVNWKRKCGAHTILGKSGLSLPSWFAVQRGSDGGRHPGSSPQSSPGPWAPAQRATVHPSCYLSPTQNPVWGDEPSQQPERAQVKSQPATQTHGPGRFLQWTARPEALAYQIHKCLSLGM